MSIVIILDDRYHLIVKTRTGEIWRICQRQRHNRIISSSWQRGGNAMTVIPDVGVLKSTFGGTLLQSGDPGYDNARRVFNAMIDRRPGLVAQCRSPSDVALIVNFARKHESLLAVRSAGHNVAGFAVCDGGIVIDLSPMKGITVDAAARSVRAEAGCTWGEVIDAL